VHPFILKREGPSQERHSPSTKTFTTNNSNSHRLLSKKIKIKKVRTVKDDPLGYATSNEQPARMHWLLKRSLFKQDTWKWYR